MRLSIPDLFERYRLVITEEAFLCITGEVQNSDGVVLIKAQKLESLAHEELSEATRTISIDRYSRFACDLTWYRVPGCSGRPGS